MADHSARDHATWSASATERNWNCSGALALTKDLPEKTSEAADWGTCCHQIAEKCLRGGVEAISFLGTTEKGKKHEFDVDEEMADTAQVYVDYCRARLAEYKKATGQDAAFFLEQKFSLASLSPPFDAGGTGDFVIIFPLWKMIEVVDLKGGRGVVVEAKGNPQGRTYGLGAMLKHVGLDVETVRVTIVQPRAGHKDGRIRNDEFHVADLVEWTTDLMARMRRSKAALDERGKLPEAAWAAKWLNPGAHCGKTFCKAQGFCPALAQRALDAAGVWFDDLDQPRLSNSPEAMAPEKLAQTLDSLDMIAEWINAVRAYAHAQAESGVAVPGYQLVEKIGNRAWKVDEAKVVETLTANGVDREHAFTRKLVSPAQAEKLLGSKKKTAIADLVERPVRGTNLVAANKTTRPAVASAVEKHFDILT